MTSPLVSVVIPTFNAARYLPDAIRSVLDQTYRNLECLVVDDGSQDETEAVARSFDQVIYLRKPNGGPSSARSMGIERSNGAYIALLDADDVWFPKKLQKQIDFMESNPQIAMTYTGFFIGDGDLKATRWVRPVAGNRALRNTLLLEKPLMTAIGSSAVVRKEVFEEVSYDDRLPPSEDWAFACDVASLFSVERIDEGLVIYRHHVGQGHRDLRRVERAATLKYEEIFRKKHLPPDLQKLKRRARANLSISLAYSYARRREFGTSMKHLINALSSRPDRLLRAVWEYLRHARGVHKRASYPFDSEGPATDS